MTAAVAAHDTLGLGDHRVDGGARESAEERASESALTSTPRLTESAAGGCADEGSELATPSEKTPFIASSIY